MTTDDTADALARVGQLPGVAPAVTTAREAIDALRGHRALRRHASAVASESALRGARASAALAGFDVPLDALRRGEDNIDPVVQGALRVAGELGTLRTTWRRAPIQVLARLHVLAAAGQVPEHELGRPTTSAAPRLAALSDLLVAPTEASALVVAAVAHAEVATADAFPVAGDIVGRAVGRLTMIDRGLDPGALGVPEVGHLELGSDAYRAALAGYQAGGPDGLAGWVVHCADAVVLGAREAVAICESLLRAG